MRIEVVKWHTQAKATSDLPRIVLQQGRTWKDRATVASPEYRTLYDVLVDVSAEERVLLGSVKILRRGALSTELQGELDGLPEDCCSLGQTIDYYHAIEGLGESLSAEVLDALRDVTENEAIARAFEGDIGFRASLLRFSEAERIYRVKPLRLHRDAPATKDLFIRFHTQLKGFDSPHDIELTFSPEPLKLGRIHALVGKNGTGKTNLLARLAMSLWGLAQEDHRRRSRVPEELL